MLLAVQQNGLALRFAAKDIRADKEVCLTAIARDWRALQFVTSQLHHDLEIVNAAVRQDRKALQMVPAILLAQIEDTAHDQSCREACNDTAV